MRYKEVQKNIGKAFDTIAYLGIADIAIIVILETYAFFKYTNSFFTTARPFVPMAEAAPVLHKVIMGGIFVFSAFLIIEIILFTVSMAVDKKMGRR